MSNSQTPSALADAMRKAEESLLGAIRQYSQSLSQQVDEVREGAIRRRRKENAFRLAVVMQRVTREVQKQMIDGNRQQREILLEYSRRTYNYWWTDPATGRKEQKGCYFHEPDEHYLGLLRVALGPNFRVRFWRGVEWVTHEWQIYAQYVDWPEEHQAPRNDGNRRHDSPART